MNDHAINSPNSNYYYKTPQPELTKDLKPFSLKICKNRKFHGGAKTYFTKILINQKSRPACNYDFSVPN